MGQAIVQKHGRDNKKSVLSPLNSAKKKKDSLSSTVKTMRTSCSEIKKKRGNSAT